ncbi:unnamed protein product, partial [Phaeothamnion confervicola]
MGATWRLSSATTGLFATGSSISAKAMAQLYQSNDEISINKKWLDQQM